MQKTGRGTDEIAVTALSLVLPGGKKEAIAASRNVQIVYDLFSPPPRKPRRPGVAKTIPPD